MARIVVVNNAVIVTSSLSLGDIKVVQKYRPEALTAYDENGEPTFAIAATNGAGRITKYGVEFGEATRDEAKLATLTIILEGATEVEDVRSAVAEAIGTPVMKLNKIEAVLAPIIAEVKAERKAIEDSIQIVQ